MTIPPSFSHENATFLYTREALFGVLALLFGVIFMIVGTGVPDGPKRADMESAPTDKT